MTTQSPTYTRDQAMAALGITSPSAFHHLRRKYPSAFVVIHQGNGRGNFTLYDKAALDRFIEWRKTVSVYNDNIKRIASGFGIPNYILNSSSTKKGKQS
jgi:hypothetical protein